MTLILLAAATNYLEYSAITGALTHNQLFFVYCLLLWFIIKFYDKLPYQNSMLPTPKTKVIVIHQIINYINQITKALFSPNFFILIFF